MDWLSGARHGLKSRPLPQRCPRCVSSPAFEGPGLAIAPSSAKTCRPRMCLVLAEPPSQTAPLPDPGSLLELCWSCSISQELPKLLQSPPQESVWDELAQRQGRGGTEHSRGEAALTSSGWHSLGTWRLAQIPRSGQGFSYRDWSTRPLDLPATEGAGVS